MNHRLRNRAFCLTAAAVLCCCQMPLAGALPAAAAELPPISAQTAESEASEPVTVIVRLNSPALLDRFDRDALTTPEAAEASAAIGAFQSSVMEKIRSIYPQMQTGVRYNLLMNGFTCTLPESLLDAVRTLPEVAAAGLLPEFQAPQMAHAEALAGIPAFREQTGCTGAGQVVAVIDSELYPEHPMFAALPDSVETKLGKEDIAALIENHALHMDVDPDRAYLSSKIPYAIDYVDDPYEGIEDPDNYHGTHVSGIAAGNAFVTEEGRTVSGIARDAQLLFFGVGRQHFSISGEMALLAIEDAVALGADVINMSWGSPMELYDDNMFAYALAAADKAGVSICVSAGNADNGTSAFGRLNRPESPDVSTVDSKIGRDSRAFVVASADNDTTYKRGVLRFADEEIIYLPTVGIDGMSRYLTDELEIGDYEYVDLGRLTTAAFGDDMPDVTGKLMLGDRATLGIDAVSKMAENAGAAGVLLVDAWSTGVRGVVSETTGVPVAVLDTEQGNLLRSAEEHRISNPGAKVLETSENVMSFYTSWGTSHSLDLRPDITGIGGNVESAAYGGGTEILSGTSMASPYIAGCTAVTRQYLKQQGIELNGTELLQYIRNLLMNTAVPFEENGMYVPPRRQGAGLAALDKMTESKVMLTGPEGDAKINLYDKNGDTLEFPVTLKNISDEDVRFSDAAIRLTTDDTVWNEEEQCNVISGQSVLACAADLSDLTEIAAGESKTVTVSVALDTRRTSDLMQTFRYGFFLDGFLVLSGAENCPDISVPLCGYYGDWAGIPIFDEGWIRPTLPFGTLIATPGLPLSEGLPMLEQVLSRVPEDELKQAMTSDVPIWMLFQLIDKYGTKEERSLLQYGSDDIWISPNGDTIADYFDAVSVMYNRQARARYGIMDDQDNVLYESERDLPPPQDYYGIRVAEKPIATFAVNRWDTSVPYENGKTYRFFADMWIDYPGAYENPQHLEMPFRTDTDAPEMFCTEYIEDNRKCLRINVRDDNELDCVFIVGNGTGHLAGLMPEEKPYTTMDMLKLYRYYRDSAENTMAEETKMPLPWICEKLCSAHLWEQDVYDFADMIIARPDQFGQCMIEYDVTDLTNYQIVVLDRAFNSAVYEAEGGSALYLREGVWIDENYGLMEIAGDQAIIVRYDDAVERVYDYTLIGRELTLTAPGEETIRRTLYFKNDREIKYIPEGADPSDQEAYKKLDLWNPESVQHLSQVRFHSVTEVKEALKRTFERITHNRVLDVECYVTVPYSVTFWVTPEEPTEEGEKCYVNVSLITGFTDSRALGGHVDIFAEPAETVKPGIYVSSDDFYVVFHEDGRTGTILIVNTNSIYEFYEFHNLPFTYEIWAEGSGTITLDGKEYACRVENASNGNVELRIETYGVLLLEPFSDDPADEANFHSRAQMEECAEAYEQALTGVESPVFAGLTAFDHSCVYYMEDGSVYTIDPFTLSGTDEYGREIDFHVIPEPPADALPLETFREWARNDYISKHGEPEGLQVYAKYTPDGKVQIMLRDPVENEDYDTYIVDAVKAVGTDAEGGAVNLPQTGNNAAGTAAASAAAVVLMLAGFALIRASRRRTN